jgi:hypothetical protein
MFFFEKKNQKTFAPIRAHENARVQVSQKSFAELFFRKATACFGATT